MVVDKPMLFLVARLLSIGTWVKQVELGRGAMGMRTLSLSLRFWSVSSMRRIPQACGG